jgi:hypothetical protein
VLEPKDHVVEILCTYKNKHSVLLLNFYHQETKLTKQLKEFDDKQLLFL